jgi:hypothetical protein
MKELTPKEAESYRAFLEKFIARRAPDGAEAVWQAMLDAKAAWSLIDREIEQVTAPARERIAAAEAQELAARRATSKLWREQWQKEKEQTATAQAPKEPWYKMIPGEFRRGGQLKGKS